MGLIVTVLHGNTNQRKQVQGNLSTSPARKRIPGKIDDLNNVDFISSNVNSSRKEGLLYIFEDNEAVVKMIIKGRRPTMRHVSRTTELLWIGCFTGFIWTPKSKSNTSTQKTNLPTF